MLKCNIDAIVHTNQDKYGIGICVRNDKGEFVIAKTIWAVGNIQVVKAEALDLLEAV